MLDKIHNTKSRCRLGHNTGVSDSAENIRPDSQRVRTFGAPALGDTTGFAQLMSDLLVIVVAVDVDRSARQCLVLPGAALVAAGLAAHRSSMGSLNAIRN